jgi:hypothetical protein
VTPRAIFAHGIVGRADLPIPAALFGAAAAVVLAVSFAALAVGWTKPRLEAVRERRVVALPLAVDVVLGLVGLAAFCAVVYAGLAGTSVEAENLAPTAIYVAFWVGIPVLSLVFGDVFRLLSPWRAVGRATGTLVRRFGGEDMAEPLPYPDRLGRWPAVAGLVLFAFAELAWGRGQDPQTLAICAIAYFAVQVVGMGLFGVEAWSRNGDAFGVYFGLFGSLSPFARRAGALVWRPPLSGAVGLTRPAGTVALLAVAIGTTTFDGASEGPLFSSVVPHLQDFFVSLGASKATGLQNGFLIGLLVTYVLVWGLFALGVAGMPRRDGTARRFVHTLIPIVAAYVVAHYFSLLVFNGQSLYGLVSDPLGDGSDLFGTSGSGVDYNAVSATAIWYVQVGALIAGHVAALALAHDRALTDYGSAREATRSQVVMLVMMIAFTCLGLWLLSVVNS